MIDNAQDVDEFLAHFGVKGMRWGQRKNRQTTSGPKNQGTSKKKKIAFGVLAVGSVFAIGYIAKNKGLTLADLQRGPKRMGSNIPITPRTSSPFGSNVMRVNGAIPLGRSQASRTMKTNGKTLLRDLPKVNGKTPIPQDTQARAAKALASFRNRPTPASVGLNTLTSSVR